MHHDISGRRPLPDDYFARPDFSWYAAFGVSENLLIGYKDVGNGVFDVVIIERVDR